MAVKKYINYVGTLPDGTVFDDNGSGEPLRVVMGGGAVMAPLMEALAAMGEGDERVVEVPAAEAYGAYDPAAILTVARAQIRGGYDLEEGQSILWRSKERPQPVAVRVIAADDEVVRIDFNHPLAGRDLTYRVRVARVEE